MFVGSRLRPVRKADNLTAICHLWVDCLDNVRSSTSHNRFPLALGTAEAPVISYKYGMSYEVLTEHLYSICRVVFMAPVMLHSKWPLFNSRCWQYLRNSLYSIFRDVLMAPVMLHSKWPLFNSRCWQYLRNTLYYMPRCFDGPSNAAQ
jgi:hypothetical protein